MNFYDYLMEHDIRLTEQQRTAVNAVDGAVLLLAVPGSGKTTVLVARLGYMIFVKHIDPESILTLTYTVSATRDMAERFRSLFGDKYTERLEFRTINGVCARIINFYGRRIGKQAFTLVTDEKVTTEMLGRIFQQVEKTYATESDLKAVRTLITYIKNMMLDKEEIRSLDETEDIKISAIYTMYQEEMRSRGLMDYDDQMVYALMILKRSPETLSYIQEKYKYICVDEAQDTSKIQHAIIGLIASGKGNIFMVGDEDQSIYGFRAAYPEALLNFEKEHPGARVLLMEENFRSKKQIVDKALHFISQNVLRHEKSMFTHRSAGGDFRTISLKSRNAGYSYLLKVAADCKAETAVLYRDNESAIPLVDLLERNGVPYRIKNMDLSFFTHRTVVDISNIIRFSLDPLDTELFLQIYYKMKTYLSKALAEQACFESRKHKLPVIDAALRYCNLPKGTVNSLQELKDHLKNLPKDKADQAVGRITRQMGYNNYLERNKMNEGKIAILRSLSYQENSPKGLLDRLEALQLLLKDKDNDPTCKFVLSTIHSSKGLEYDTVYLMDVMDGVFPQEVPDIAWKSSSLMKSASGDDLQELETFEEERRLFYVGITRAKNALYLFEYKNEDTTFINELLD
ncbi:MAG: ATP-dependent helicase, partial [Oribacterium sp.]|nr:ATP-dependent helicase [Oribacterium sp.]